MMAEAVIEQLGRQIRAGAARLPTQISTLFALTDAGFDTIEAEAAMWR